MEELGSGNETMEEQASVSGVSKDQVKVFKSFKLLKAHVESLGLKRVLVQDMPGLSDMNGCYVGGKIVSVLSDSYSQGHDARVFVEDGGMGEDALHAILKVSGELIEVLPSINSEYMLFVSGAHLEDDEIEFSQDTGNIVIVEGSEVRLWVVHPKGNDPKLYQIAFGPDWWRQAKKRRQRRKLQREKRKNERQAPSVARTEREGESSSTSWTSWISSLHHVRKPMPQSRAITEINNVDKSPSKPGPSGISGINSGGGTSKPGPSGISEINDVNGVSGAGEADNTFEHHCPISNDESSQSFPDDADFPESAFAGSQSPQQEERERDNDNRSTPTSSSSETESETEGESESDTAGSETDTLWTPKKGSKVKYQYTKLGDLEPGQRKVNVIGVVKEFGEPRITRGTEYCFLLTLLDETNPLVGIKCVTFNSAKERLPHVKREGDIVCLHRVNVSDYRNVMQIDGPPFSSSLRFSSKIANKIKPSTGCLSYTFTATERRRVRELRQWVQQRRIEHALKLEAISRGQKFDLLCQIVWIAQLASTNQTVLSVWDGSLCPLITKSFEIAEAEIQSNTGLSAIIGPTLQRQILIKGKLSPKLKLKPGSYIHISNLEASTQNETIELHMKGKAQENIEILPTENHSCSELKSRLISALCSQAVVTTTPNAHISLSTLQRVKDYQLPETPGKFHCKVKLLGVLTPSVEEMVYLSCDNCELFKPIPKSTITELESGLCTEPCPLCSKDSQESHVPHCMFLVRLLVADYTTTLEVHIPHDEAITLFNGVKPTNLYQHQTVRYMLMTKLYQLSGGNPPFSQDVGDHLRPWIDCCLLKVREEQQIYYCVFDTLLK